jgi:hypothetical protein
MDVIARDSNRVPFPDPNRIERQMAASLLAYQDKPLV